MRATLAKLRALAARSHGVKRARMRVRYTPQARSDLYAIYPIACVGHRLFKSTAGTRT
jgi:hypothetical protein